MKLNSSVLVIAPLCGSLFLSLSPGCSGRSGRTASTPSPTATIQTSTPESSTPTPSPTPPLASPTPTPTASPATPSPSPSPESTQLKDLAGSYTLNDPGATARIKKAIEYSVKGMSVGEGSARKTLEEANLPPPEQLTISYTPTEVTITTKVAGSLTTPANGKPTKWTWKGDTYDVSTRWENNKLVRTFARGERKRVNTYSLEDGGKTLVMQVHATGKFKVLFVEFSLKHDLDYVLRYRRTSK